MSADRLGDTGATLRGARERKGVTLRQIAERTKISVAALEALERNDISRLPGGIFSRAFVRSYANEVGLDAEATIQAFMAQFPQDSVTAGHPRTDRVEDTELFESEQRVASSVVWLFVVSVAVAGAAIYFGMMRRGGAEVTTAAPVASSQPEVKPDVPPPSDPATASAPTPASRSSWWCLLRHGRGCSPRSRRPGRGPGGSRRPWRTHTSRSSACG